MSVAKQQVTLTTTKEQSTLFLEGPWTGDVFGFAVSSL
jgi:hypothetical protein